MNQQWTEIINSNEPDRLWSAPYLYPAHKENNYAVFLRMFFLCLHVWCISVPQHVRSLLGFRRVGEALHRDRRTELHYGAPWHFHSKLHVFISSTYILTLSVCASLIRRLRALRLLYAVYCWMFESVWKYLWESIRNFLKSKFDVWP